jgi:hypothetical protein
VVIPDLQKPSTATGRRRKLAREKAMNFIKTLDLGKKLRSDVEKENRKIIESDGSTKEGRARWIHKTTKGRVYRNCIQIPGVVT